MQRTAIINDIDGNQRKEVFTGENFQEICEQIKTKYNTVTDGLRAHMKKPGQYWTGYCEMYISDITHITIEL